VAAHGTITVDAMFTVAIRWLIYDYAEIVVAWGIFG
jgi:hypothetical protein